MLTFVKKNTDSSKRASIICCLLEIIYPLSPLKKSPFLTYSISGVFLNYLHGSEQANDFNVVMVDFLSYLHGSERLNLVTWSSPDFLSYLHGSEHMQELRTLGFMFLSYLHGSELESNIL